MCGRTLAGIDCRLDRLHRGTRGVVLGLLDIHRATDRTARIDAGTTGLVREADEVRVGEAVGKMRQVGALAVVQVEDRLDRNRCGRHLGLDFCLLAVAFLERQFFQRHGNGVGIRPGIGHHAQVQHHQVGLQRDVFVQDQVLEVDRGTIAAAGHVADLALGEDHHLLLAGAVEVLAGRTRGAQVVEQDRGVAVLAVLRLEIHGLFDRDQVADARVVRQVTLCGRGLAGVLHEHHGFHFLAIRRALDRAVAGLPGQCLELDVADHVGVR